LLGTLFGAYLIGVISDLLGRKPLLMLCVGLFSLSMLAAAFAPDLHWFMVARFIGGLGLGGVISVAAALTIEYSPVHRRNLNFALMYSGYPLGVLLASLTSIAWLQSHGWQMILALGALGVLLVPVIAWLLPESIEHLVQQGRNDRAEALANRLGVRISSTVGPVHDDAVNPGLKGVVKEVFVNNGYGTLCLWITQFMAVMVMYGLGTWLPQIMRKNGYDLGSSLSFLAVYSLAAAIGGVLIGRVADRFGERATIAFFFILGAVGVAALSLKVPVGLTYLFVTLAGVGSVGVALVLLGYISNYYAAHARASATGWAVGVGRFGAITGPILGGYIVQAGIPLFWNFIIFAGAALIAALAVMCSPLPHARRVKAASEPEASRLSPEV
jgi:AAHS family benzoate transporter-like MFS transporter